MLHEGLYFHTECQFFNTFSRVDTLVRYLKTKYSNVERLEARCFSLYRYYFKAIDKPYLSYVLDDIVRMFKILPAFNYKDAFELENASDRSIVFGVIDVSEMIRNLGSQRLKVEGKELTQRVYSEDGSYYETPITVVYELYSVDCSEIGGDPDTRAIKCWCTSTNKEHWLWLEGKPESPLEGVASTCFVYPNMIGKIRCIKRQGDVFLFEMLEEVHPEGNPVSLDMDTYFSLLVCQT